MLTWFASIALTLLLAGPPPPASRLAIIRTAPDFALVDSGDRKVGLKQFRGKVVLVSFIFTTCNGSCPATTHRMAKVQGELARHADLKDKVQLVSITLDPERDTAARLNARLESLERLDGDLAERDELTLRIRQLQAELQVAKEQAQEAGHRLSESRGEMDASLALKRRALGGSLRPRTSCGGKDHDGRKSRRF